MSVRRVLVFPAGTEIGLEIHEALRWCKEVELFGAGQAVSNHAPFVFERYQNLPSVHEPGWCDALVALCRQWQIDYVFPAYDDVIVALREQAQHIPAVVLAPSLQACQITRSKSRTYAHLTHAVRVPEVYTHAQDRVYPLIVKPDSGQGSQGVSRVDRPEDLAKALLGVREPLLCEYLPGAEYTVDCFSDRERGVLFCGARERLRMRNGIAVSTRTVDLPEVKAWAQAIGECLQLHGAWFFQLKRARDGELTLLEVAPRIAGSMCAHRVQGVNFALLTIFEHERLPLAVQTLPVQVSLDRALKNRFVSPLDFEALYIDLDDTLVLRGQVNLQALRLVYACINGQRPVILITRHAADLPATLARHRLTGLFDQVIHITDGRCKSQFIAHPGAILVDDSYSERHKVHQALGIPTLDPSMIELLIESPQLDCAQASCLPPIS